MPIRASAPTGSPCWTDLWTSDVDGSRRFYSELMGWEAQEPSPEFGGYFMFTRDGVPVAGAMGPMGDMSASDSWSVYLSVDDLAKTLVTAEQADAQIVSPAMEIADLGRQAVLVDPTGAQIGAWQPGTFPGFTVLGEPGAPSWFELHTRDHATAVDFYRSTFGWDTDIVADTDEFRYTTMLGPDRGEELAGIMDVSTLPPDSFPVRWGIYWEVHDVDAAVAKVEVLGGSVEADAEDTPYGRIAMVADPAGASFRLRARPAGER